MSGYEDPPELSLAVIEELKGRGYSQSEIARMFDVSRQAISWWKHHYGGRKTPREMVMESWPFKVPKDMQMASPCRRLRDHAEYVVTSGIGMSKAKTDRLRWFYQRLDREGLVIEFDPTLPPEAGVSTAGGWAYRKRLPSDADLLIRQNEYTTISEYGRRIWRLPPPDLRP